MWACGIHISPKSQQSFPWATFEKCLKGPKEVQTLLCSLAVFSDTAIWLLRHSAKLFSTSSYRQGVGIGTTCGNMPWYVIFIISLGKKLDLL